MTTAHTVHLNKNGAYWSARWTDSEGKPRSKGLGAIADVSKRAAMAKCKALENEHARNPVARDVGTAPRLQEWTAEFLRIKTDMKDETRWLYEQTIAYLHRFFDQDPPINRITSARADDFRVWLEKQPAKGKKDEQGNAVPIGAWTVAKHIRNARVIFDLAVKPRKLIAANPFADVDAATPALEQDWHVVSRADLEKILDACTSDAWRAAFALARLAGLRRGELVALEWGHIDFDEKTIQVKARKDGRGKRRRGTKQRDRSVPVEPRLYAILRECYDRAPEGAVRVCPIGGAKGTNNIERDARATLKRAKLPDYAKPLHTLRKNLQSEWEAEHSTLNVCAWLGNSPAVAAEHYNKPPAEAVARITGGKDPLAEALAEIERLRARLGQAVA